MKKYIINLLIILNVMLTLHSEALTSTITINTNNAIVYPSGTLYGTFGGNGVGLTNLAAASTASTASIASNLVANATVTNLSQITQSVTYLITNGYYVVTGSGTATANGTYYTNGPLSVANGKITYTNSSGDGSVLEYFPSPQYWEFINGSASELYYWQSGNSTLGCAAAGSGSYIIVNGAANAPTLAIVFQQTPVTNNTVGYSATNSINDSTVLSITTNSGFSSPSFPSLPPYAWSGISGTNFVFYNTDTTMSNFTFCGGILPAYNVDYFAHCWYPSNNNTGGTGASGFEQVNGFTHSFSMDGYLLCLQIFDYGRTFQMQVNGQYVGVPISQSADGNYSTYLFQFATPNRRNITLVNAMLCAVGVPATNSIVPIYGKRHTVAVLGDSFSEQAYIGYSAYAGWVSQWQTLRPDLNIIPCAEGGTGYYNVGINGGTNFPARVVDLAKCNPEAVVVYGGINDQSWATDTSLTNIVYVKATNTFANIRLQIPNASIFVVGPETGVGVTVASNPTYFNEVTIFSNAVSAVQQIYGGNIQYVNSVAWITGAQATPNSGNAVQYVDPIANPHPSVAGCQFYAKQIDGAFQQMQAPIYPNDSRTIYGIFSGQFGGPTNVTAPGNTSAIRAWINFTNSTGGVFKMPLYQ